MEQIRSELRAFFRPANAMLYDLLGLGGGQGAAPSNDKTGGRGFVTIGFDRFVGANGSIWGY
jgi:hypothetical protein